MAHKTINLLVVEWPNNWENEPDFRCCLVKLFEPSDDLRALAQCPFKITSKSSVLTLIIGLFDREQPFCVRLESINSDDTSPNARASVVRENCCAVPEG